MNLAPGTKLGPHEIVSLLGVRDYLIDVSTGDSKPVTPEGVAGTRLSPDGSRAAVLGPNGQWGAWPIDGSGLRPIPGLDSKYNVTGWAPDGKSVYAQSSRSEPLARVSKVDVATGKMEPWKTFGVGVGAGVSDTGAPLFSADGSAYAYVYAQALSNAYVVTGLK